MILSQVKNIVIALINGIFVLIVLLTTNLSRSSLLPISFLFSLSTYGAATMGDRLMLKPKSKSSKNTVVYRSNHDDDTLSD
jgi:hypothetical protein